jgi:hypothetical protein
VINHNKAIATAEAVLGPLAMNESVFLVVVLVLGLELRAFTLSHSTSPIFCDRVFRDKGSRTICPGWF